MIITRRDQPGVNAMLGIAFSFPKNMSVGISDKDPLDLEDTSKRDSGGVEVMVDSEDGCKCIA